MDEGMETEEILKQWGRWAYEDRKLRLNYGSNILRPPSSKSGSYIGDEAACAVDKIISELATYMPEHAAVVSYYYLGVPPAQVCKICNVSKTKMYQMLDAGRRWIEGYMAHVINS